MSRRGVLGLLVAIGVGLGLAPAMARADQTVTADGVTASLYGTQQFGVSTLSISAVGGPAFSTTLWCAFDCSVAPQIVRMGPGPRPDVIVERGVTETGPSEEGIIDVSYSVAAHGWVQANEDSGSPVTVEPLGGGYSGFVRTAVIGNFWPDQDGPIQIQRAVNGSFVDVTTHWPALIRADAARWFQAWQSAPADDNAAPLAAWAGDEMLLGRGTAAVRYLDAQDGRLNAPFGMPISAGEVLEVLANYGYTP